MNRILMILLATILICGRTSAQTVTFRFQEGTLSDASLREKMEERISCLLSEITQASKANRPLSLDSLSLSPKASKRLSMLWDNLHFSCDDTEIIEKCLQDINGYEVRSIFVTLQPTADGYMGELERELVISFDTDGQITGVRMAMGDDTYLTIQNRSIDAADFRKRLEILRFLEDYRSYYEEKNIEALHDDIYNENVGFCTSRSHIDGDTNQDLSEFKLKIENYDTKEVISRLTKAFANNKYVTVKFDQIQIMRHFTKRGFYVVRFHQELSCGEYPNNGYMFMIWELREGRSPVLQVRAWQPEIIDGHRLTPDELITENEFFIP